MSYNPNSPIVINRAEAERCIFAFLGEFGYEMISWLPYLLFLKEKLNIRLTTLSRKGSGIFYYFSDRHYEVGPELIGDMWGNPLHYQRLAEHFNGVTIVHPGPDFINQRYISIEGYEWRNKNIHSIIDTTNYSILDFSFVKSEFLENIRKPFVVLNNKYFRQWYQKYKAPINYFDVYELMQIKECLNKLGYFVVYNHFVEKTSSDEYFHLDDQKIFTDSRSAFDLSRLYEQIDDIGERNKLQIAFYNEASFVIGPQGGNLYLPAVCKKNLWILMRDGIYLDYMEFARLYDIEVNIFYEPFHLISSLLNFQKERNTRKITQEAIKKLHYAITGNYPVRDFNEKDLPKISIGIFTYNRGNLIGRAIQSALNQDYPNYEIVVVDDGSTDNTKEVVEQFHSEKIRYFYKNHTNAPDTRNYLIEKASGEFIIWLGSDDELMPNALSIYKEYMRNFPDVDIFYCKLEEVDEKGKRFRVYEYDEWYFNKPYLLVHLYFGSPMPDGGTLIRKKIYEEIGNYNTSFTRAHDYEFWARLAISEKFEAKYVPEILYKYYIHSSNLTGVVDENVDTSFESRILEYIITAVPFDKLFPILNWVGDEKRSLSNFYFFLAHRFLQLRNFEKGMYYILESIREYPNDSTMELLNGLLQEERLREMVIEGMIKFGDERTITNIYKNLDEDKQSLLNLDFIREKIADKQSETEYNPNAFQDKREKELCLVSVIMPTAGNRREKLIRAVNSVLSQSYRNFEIILVNDGGPVELEDLIRSLDKEGKIKYIRNEQNFERSVSRNIGIKNSSGKYICYLDDDDIFYENHIETLVDFLESSDYKVAYTDAYRAVQVLEHGEYITVKKDVPYSKDFDYNEILVGNFIPILCLMHRRECLDKVGLFDENINTHEDYDLIIRLSREYKLAHIKRITCEFSWCAEPSESFLRTRKDMLKSLTYIYYKTNELVKNNPLLQEARKINIKYFEAEIKQIEMKLQGSNTELANSVAQKNADIQKEPIVSIIIPVLNNLEFTRNCLKSIYRTCEAFNYEIIIVDNGSQDGTVEFLKSEMAKNPRLRVIFNEVAQSFSKSNNLGANIARGRYLVFLNNDTEVLPGWLSSIVDNFENDADVGIQGAQLLYPDNTIQHCGIVYGRVSENLDLHYHIYLKFPMDAECVNKKREFQMVTGALLAIRKDLFQSLGGFDESYYFGYEDLDLCLQVRKTGKKVIYNPECKAYHYEAKTKQAEGIEKFERFIVSPNSYDAQNHKYFMSKWANFLRRDADDYYREDGYYALISDAELKEQYANRFNSLMLAIKGLVEKGDLSLLKKIVAILQNKQENEVNLEGDINFQTIPEAKLIKIEEILAQKFPAEMKLTHFERGKSMRVLFTMYGWNETGGGTTLPKEEAIALAKKGIEVAVFYAGAKHATNSLPYYLEKSEDNGVILYGVFNRPTIFLDAENPDREIRDDNIVRLVEQVLEEFQPNIVHFQNFLGLSFAIADVAKSKGIKCIFTPHNYHLIDPTLYLINPNLSIWKNTNIFENSQLVRELPHLLPQFEEREKQAKRLLNEILDYTLAVSTRQKEILSEFCGCDKKIAVVNQVNKTIGSIPAKRLSRGKIEFPIRFCYIGGVMVHKGVHNIAYASQLIDPKKAKFRIWGFVGDDYLTYLEGIDKKKVLEFRGKYEVDDLGRIAEESDVVIVPSIWEDCAPLVIAEALAVGLPVIASNIGGIPDFVVDNFNGRLYQYDSVAELVRIVQEFIEEPNKILELHKNCYVPYDFDYFIEHLIGIYRRVLQNKYINVNEINLLFKEKLQQRELSTAEKDKTMSQPKFDSGVYRGFSSKKAVGRLEYPLPSPLYLNLGCGNDIRDGFINIDLYSDDPRVVYMDVRKLEFADNSVDGILASDILEHFSHREVDDVLREWTRVLKPGGELVIRCPSLRLQMKAYMEGRWDADVASYMIFGGQSNPGDFHCVGFDAESLSRRLRNLGYNIVMLEEQDLPQDQGYINLNMVVRAVKMGTLGGQDFKYDYNKNFVVTDELIGREEDFIIVADEDAISEYLQLGGLDVLKLEEIKEAETEHTKDFEIVVRASKPVTLEDIMKSDGGAVSEVKEESLFKELEINEVKEEIKPSDSIFVGFSFEEVKDVEQEGRGESEIQETSSVELWKELNVVWEGSQLVYHSLALINREHCSNLIDTGLVEVTIIPFEEDQFDASLNEKYQKLLKHDIRYKPSVSEEVSKLPYVWVRHQWPPKFDPPRGAKWVIMQPWEYSALRKDFAELFNQADEIWTPSNFSRRCMVNSGVDFNKVQVIPNGIDPELFKPNGNKYNLPTDKRLKLLFVGGTIFRKGIDILLEAYTKIFSAQDDICLVIKDMGGDSFYRGQTAKQNILEFQKQANAPEIIYIDEYLNEQEMTDLYRACDVFVCPYRGEGFSLPTLEAMACGLPVIVTKGGSTDDFVDETFGWLIPATQRSIGDKIGEHYLTNEAYVLEPDIDYLMNVLKFIYENPASICTKGLLGMKVARTQWTWKRATMKIFARLDYLYGKQMSRKAKEILIDKIDGNIVLADAEIEFQKQNFATAIELYQKALNTDDLSDKYKLLAYNRLAEMFINEGKLELAQNLINNAKAIPINNPDALYLQSLIYKAKDAVVEQMDIYTLLFDNWRKWKFDTTIGVAQDELFVLAGEAIFNTGDPDGAFKLFSEALKFNPENAEACYWSAKYFLLLEMKEDAQKMLEWALKIKPDYQEAKSLLKEMGSSNFSD